MDDCRIGEERAVAPADVRRVEIARKYRCVRASLLEAERGFSVRCNGGPDTEAAAETGVHADGEAVDRPVRMEPEPRHVPRQRANPGTRNSAVEAWTAGETDPPRGGVRRRAPARHGPCDAHHRAGRGPDRRRLRFREHGTLRRVGPGRLRPLDPWWVARRGRHRRIDPRLSRLGFGPQSDDTRFADAAERLDGEPGAVRNRQIAPVAEVQMPGKPQAALRQDCHFADS